MSQQHPRDTLLALALGQLDPEERDATLRHLGTCAECRAEYDELTAGVEAALAATPTVDPPAGFEARVVAAMTRDHPPGWAETPGSGGDRLRPRGRLWNGLRSRWTVGLAGVAAGLAIGVVGVDQWTPGQPQTSVVTAAPGSLRTDDGTVVGRVTSGFADDVPVLVISVRDGRVGMSYVCRVRLRDGRSLDVATWLMRSPRATWVVDAPAGEVEQVLLVANGGDGPVWSRTGL